MGCAQSRIDNEESVSRCKERRNLMKDAVSARNAFASAHTAYSMALKNTGAALSDYSHGESLQNYQNAISSDPLDPAMAPPPLPPPPPLDNLQPPPPLPEFSPILKRSSTMPAMPVKKPDLQRHPEPVPIAEEEELEEEEVGVEGRSRLGNGGGEQVENLRRRPRRRNGSSGVVVEKGGASIPRTPPPVSPMPESKGMAWDYFFNVVNMPGPSLDNHNDNDDEEIVDDVDANEGAGYGGMENSNNDGVGSSFNGVEPETPEKVVEEKVVVEEEEDIRVEQGGEKQMEHSKTAPADFRRAVKAVSSVSLMKVMSDIDDHFLKASESAHEVSKMLEATRLHYHSNFADNRGHIDHSARVMRVITWNKSFRGMPNADGSKDDFDADEFETHATVLDKLLAWEKKLYEEVKHVELMKVEYQRKVSQLTKQKKRGVASESLEKTKAAVSHLHTRYIVDMQSMDSTASEINHIRDEQLYPKLVLLVDGMAKMWESMCMHHERQLVIANELKSLDISQAPKETTKHHYERTVQLHKVAEEWHNFFERLVTHQKEYIQALYCWLKLNLIPIDSSLKEKVSSPPRPQNPPIQALLIAWDDHLEKLPDELAKSATSAFVGWIKIIMLHQEEEMKLKEKCEETRKEYLRKNQAFEDWYQKYMMKKASDETRGEDGSTNDPVVEKQAVVEVLKKRLEEDLEAHQRHCVQVREKSLGSLRVHLPELFRAMSDYARASADAFAKLRSITMSRKLNGISS